MSVLEQAQLALMQVNQAQFEYFNPPTYPVTELPYAQEYGAGARYIPPNLSADALTTYTAIRVARTRNLVVGVLLGLVVGAGGMVLWKRR